MSSEPKKTRDAEIIDTVFQQGGRVIDIYLRQPEDMDFDVSHGIGVPASLLPHKFAELKSLLSSLDGQEGLLPHDGLPGPDYAALSDSFLECLLTKACAMVDAQNNLPLGQQDLKKNTACLYMAMNDPELKDRLKANYSVFDLLKLFPRVVRAQDVIERVPKEKGGKTYTVDGRDTVMRNGVKCFRINVTQDYGPAHRALFGETKAEGVKPGQASSYLHGLKAGDTLTFNEKVKQGPPVPALGGDARPVLIVSQGNALIGVLSLIEDIRKRKASGESFGPVILVGAFKSQEDIMELEELRPYLDDGTLSDLHLCLSDEKQTFADAHDNIHVHSGTRIQELLATQRFTQLDDPFVWLTGGENFCEGAGSVGAYIADLYGLDMDEIMDQKKVHKDMRISRSPNRRHSAQGQPYPPIDTLQALAKFSQRGEAPHCGCSQRAPKLR